MNITAAILALSLSATAVMPGDVKTPSSGHDVIGSYASGCIAGAKALPINGGAYQITHLYRNRYYGHENLIGFIQNFSNQVYTSSGQMLLIGDLSQPRGGRMPYGHSSHQNGLDVDIWFETAKQQLPAKTLDKYQAPDLVGKDNEINPQLWQPWILYKAAQFPEVERIFVNAAIKKQLCAEYAGQDWLRKIRPWRYHKDHFHVRLSCPEGDASCESQPPIPTGDGCDDKLDWWLNNEPTEQKTTQNPIKTNSKADKSPPICQKIFAE